MIPARFLSRLFMTQGSSAVKREKENDAESCSINPDRYATHQTTSIFFVVVFISSANVYLFSLDHPHLNIKKDDDHWKLNSSAAAAAAATITKRNDSSLFLFDAVCTQFSRGIFALLAAVSADSFGTIHSYANTYHMPFFSPWFPEKVRCSNV